MRPRVIPVLFLLEDGIYNTVKFKPEHYIGDPINTVKLYNEMMVDEVILLDGWRSRRGTGPDLAKLDKIRSQSFFPLSYGGGISSVQQASSILSLGIEKVVINSLLFEDLNAVKEIIAKFGAQSVVLSIDIKRNLLGKNRLYCHKKKKLLKRDPLTFLIDLLHQVHPGEILLTSVDRDGKSTGYDIELLEKVASEFASIPIVINGGARNLQDMVMATKAGAHASAATSLFVYKNGGVLINYPGQRELKQVFDNE